MKWSCSQVLKHYKIPPNSDYGIQRFVTGCNTTCFSQMTFKVGKDGLINVFQFVLKSSYRMKKRNMN